MSPGSWISNAENESMRCLTYQCRGEGKGVAGIRTYEAIAVMLRSGNAVACRIKPVDAGGQGGPYPTYSVTRDLQYTVTVQGFRRHIKLKVLREDKELSLGKTIMSMAPICPERHHAAVGFRC